MSAAGRWNHQNVPAQPYGDDTTYRIGADFLRGLATEDWGCGLGWYRRFHEGPYVGIDGSPSEFADIVCDLSHRRSRCEGLFMRHVLEHNANWRVILENALASFSKKMVLVVFTPFHDAPGDKILTVPGLPIPDIGLSREDFVNLLRKSACRPQEHRVASVSRYNTEAIWLLQRA
jgi:hypothetical protein